METLIVILICSWALYFTVRNIFGRLNKKTSCCQGCKGCSDVKESCESKDKDC